jgi:hypothetical protein
MNCSQCGVKIPIHVRIDGKKRNLKNRTKCLICLPFMGPRPKRSSSELKIEAAQKSRRYYQKWQNEHSQCIVTARRIKYRTAIISLVNKCQFCSYNKPDILIFHHLYNKSFGLNSRSFKFSLRNLIPELMKCVLVCPNCHSEIHKKFILTDLVTQKNEEFKIILNKICNLTWLDLKVGRFDVKG